MDEWLAIQQPHVADQVQHLELLVDLALLIDVRRGVEVFERDLPQPTNRGERAPLIVLSASQRFNVAITGSPASKTSTACGP